MVILTNVREVVEALGGIHAVARLTSVDPHTVSAWQTRLGVFPSKTFVVLNDALAEIAMSAPAHLWQMVEREKAS